MDHWAPPLVRTVLIVAGLLGVAELARATIGPLRRLAMPGALLAGALGFLLGPEGVGAWGWPALPFDVATLEAATYHGLGVLFVAIALQTPERTDGAGADGRSMGFAITTMIALQTAVGLACALALHTLTRPTHPGVGLLLPLGFEQGPGQAMAVGGAWEASGLVHGTQLGLLVAALGFVWCVVAGVPWVAYGRARGLARTASPRASASTTSDPTPVEAPDAPGAIDRASRQFAAIGVVYAVTWGVCVGLSAIVRRWDASLAEMVFGFHFIVGAVVALGFRAALTKWDPAALDDRLLGRVAGLSVDVLTVCALAAVQLAAVRDQWLAVGVVTTAGGLVTLAACVVLAPRAFREAPFEHAVVWFGMSTGTLPMGLALLRVVDPDLRSPAPVSALVGSAASILGAVPLVFVIHPAVVAAWPDAWPGRGVAWLGATVVYLIGVVVVWWATGGLRLGPTVRPAAGSSS